ncbi:LemA family protein [Pseudoalteromonas sp. T1lg24]|uniref:LemA family protein n=1 Tax=Pseudoalteromonas sp. T1lg24 TaxID=2077099 RepID=UPI000CF65C51|nr:LemA family protein [Pseudoalteromonas sp. T1lg24]
MTSVIDNFFSTIGILLLILALLAVFVIVIFNTLVKYRNYVINAFAQIDVQLHRRHDLIPNLVNTCQAYLKHESSTLEQVTKARNAALSYLEQAKQAPNNGALIKQLANAENTLTQALSGLQITIEDYPELKANETVKDLHEELVSTENKIAFARQAYNDEVMQYNTYKQSFPNNLVAAKFGHKNDASVLELEKTSIRQAPSVQL